MPLSRPVILALLGAVLAAVMFIATSGARQQAVSPAAEQSKPAPKKAVAEKPAVEAKKPETAAAPAKPSAEKAQAQTPAKPAKPAPPAKPAKPVAIKVEGVPGPLARALAKERVIVLFFRQTGSADDRAVARAVSAQKGRKGVSVFSDNISRLARYRAVVGPLGISQAPAVVIVGRNGEAQIVEGFVDEGSLTQQVVDAK